MTEISTQVLRQLLDATTEPLALVGVDDPDSPVVLTNPAFDALAGENDVLETPFHDVLVAMIGPEMAREAGAAVRTLRGATLPVVVGSREYLLSLLPIAPDNKDVAWFGAYFRTAGRHMPNGPGKDTLRALAHATRKVRDLSGKDPVTGLLNERAFRDVLAHDWAVASREDRVLCLTAFSVNDFDAYRGVFGAHGGDSCLRRVSIVISRHLRRASDVSARIEGPAGSFLVILTHGSDADGLKRFGDRIGAAVRELGLHHPRSQGERYVTLSHRTLVCRPRVESELSGDALDRLVSDGER